MKYIKLLILLLISNMAMAHQWSFECKWNNSYSFKGQDGSPGVATITKVNANGTNVTGTGAYTITINVPADGNITLIMQSSGITRLRITWSDGQSSIAISNNTSCAPLASKLLDFQAIRVDDSLLVRFVVTNEEQEAYYRLKINNKTYVIWVDPAKSGTYYFKIKL